MTATSTTGQQIECRRLLDLHHRPAAADRGNLPLHALPGHGDTNRDGVQRRRSAGPWRQVRELRRRNITGVRFYKAAGNIGTHTGTLFTVTGQQLATVTFTGETSAGWQTATFSQPVAIAADTEYVAAYEIPTGKYSATPGGFESGFTSGPLRTAAAPAAYSYSGDFPSVGISIQLSGGSGV